MAAESSYSGGIGGKFRKRPFRRPVSTPYDRPPTAVRSALRAINAEGERNGIFSRILDSAPKILVSAASKLFSSVKRLGAPHPIQAPDAAIEAREETVGLIPDSSDVSSQSPSDNPCTEKPSTDGILELEKLLQQKTFTKAQFDQLTELLRSRTVASPENKQSNPNATRPDTHLETEENLSVQLEKRNKEPILFASNTLSTIHVNVPEKEIASPAELAKAYMVSRPSKLSTPISGLQSPAPREATPLPSSRAPLPKPSDLAVVPRSMVRSSGLSENGYKTLRSQGRSAIYKMSRSPYFKAQSLLPAKNIEPPEQLHAQMSGSQLVPSDISDSKQVLKRRSSFLESDVGSFGPIRRIRHKSNLITPEKEVTGKYLYTPVNNMHVSMSSIWKPFPADAPSNSNSGLGGDTSEGFAPAPRKSVQMATKIFQQLDLLGSPPNEKGSELKAVIKDESPSKLSINMLRGKALVSLKDIGTSKFLSLDNDNHCSSSNTKDRSISISLKAPTVVRNGPSCSPPSNKHADQSDIPIVAATAASQEKPGFSMQVPEVSSDGDIDNQGGSDTPNLSNTCREPSIQVSTSEISSKKPPVSYAEAKSNSVSVPIEESEKKRELPKVPGEDNGFSFPVASKSSLSQLPPTPTMLSPTLKPPAISKDEGLEPAFSFGSGKVTSLTFSAVTSDPKATVTSVSNTDTFVSTSLTRTTHLELPKFMKGKETEKIGDSLKPFQSSTSSITFGSTSLDFISGAPASVLSNGSLKPLPSILSTSTSTTLPPNGVSVAAAFSSSSPAHDISSSSTMALASKPAFSLATTSFGSSAAVLTDTATPLVATKCTLQGLEDPSSKESIFSSSNDLVATASSAFASSVTSIFGLSSATSVSKLGTSSAQLLSSEMPKSVNGSNSVFGQGTSNTVSATYSSSHGSSLATSAYGFPASGFGSSTSASAFSFGLNSGSEQNSSTPFPGHFSTPSTSSVTTLLSSSCASASSMMASNLFSASSASTLPSSVTAPILFGSGSQPAPSPVFGSGSTSSFSFGQSPTVSGASSFSFGSSGSNLSFASAPSTDSAPPPASMTAASIAFGSSLPGNDQMNVEVSMADDTVQQSQTTMSLAPTFSPAANTTAPSTFGFGSPQPSGSVPFQFGSQPSAAFPQAQSAFHPPSNLEFGVSGSFSLGSGGAATDKSARKMIRVRKDNKNRKK